MKTLNSEMMKIASLGPIQLKRLRNDILLNSVFKADYQNRYGIDPGAVCAFFDGYADYIQEIMEEDGAKDSDYFDNLKKYDNAQNLRSWQDCVACGLGC